MIAGDRPPRYDISMQTAIAGDRPPRYGGPRRRDLLVSISSGRRDLLVSMQRLSTIAGDRPPRYGGPMLSLSQY